MKYFYEDILSKVGEDGRWQIKTLFCLWVILFIVGARLILSGHVMQPDNFFCEDPNWNCSNFDKSWMTNEGGYIAERIAKFSYDRVFPRLKKMHQEQRSFSLLEEDFSSSYYCQVYRPSMLEDGTCFWDTRHIGHENYTCGTSDRFHFYDDTGPWNAIATDLGRICREFNDILISRAIDVSVLILFILIIRYVTKIFGRRPGLTLSVGLGFFGDILQLSIYQFSSWGWHIGYLLSVQGVLTSVAICFIYLVETIGLKEQMFSFLPNCIRNGSLLGMSFLIPFVIGKAAGDFLHNVSFLWIPQTGFHQTLFWSTLLITGVLIAVTALGNLSETPRWLLTNYKLRQAEELIQTISKTNGKNFEVTVRLESEEESQSLKEGSLSVNAPTSPRPSLSSLPTGIFSFILARAHNLVWSLTEEPVTVKQSRRQRDGAICSENVKIAFGPTYSRKNDVMLEFRRYSLVKLLEPETILFTFAIFFNVLIVAFCHLFVNFRFERSMSSTYTTRLLEVGGLVTLMLVEGFIGRKRCLMLLLLILGFTMLAVQLVLDANNVIIFDTVKNDIQRGLLHVVDFCSTAMFSTLIWFSMSVYPTSLRSSVVFLFIGAYGVASLISPNVLEVLILIDVEELQEIQRIYFFLSMAFFIGALLSYYLPEIIHRPMPITMDDVMFLKLRSRKFMFSNSYYYRRVLCVD